MHAAIVADAASERIPDPSEGSLRMPPIGWLLLAVPVVGLNVLALALGKMASRGERRVIAGTKPRTESPGPGPQARASVLEPGLRR